MPMSVSVSTSRGLAPLGKQGRRPHTDIRLVSRISATAGVNSRDVRCKPRRTRKVDGLVARVRRGRAVTPMLVVGAILHVTRRIISKCYTIYVFVVVVTGGCLECYDMAHDKSIRL